MASTVVTVLAIAGAGLAIRLELAGLGRPRDTDPRAAYLALLALVSIIPAAVTFVLYRWAGVSSWWMPVGLVLAAAALFVSITGLRPWRPLAPAVGGAQERLRPEIR